MRSDDREKRFSWQEYGLLLLCFLICLIGAFLLSSDQCPDEAGRLLLTDWIVQTGTLPRGNEIQTIIIPENAARLNAVYPTVTREIGAWGFSYALRPYFSSMVGALFQKLTSCFTDASRMLLAAARMCSVLSITFCCFFCLRLGHRLFAQRNSALLFAAFVCFLPQVMFLGMYLNSDSLSLCAVCMMLYYMIEGFDLRWPVKSCIGLAVGFSIGLLSYYAIYGWLLMGAVFCVFAVLTDPEIPYKGRLIFRRAGLIFGICVLFAGWFFIRNACLHNGDFLGIASEKVSREYMREQGFALQEYICYRDEGMSAAQFLRFKGFEWLRMNAESFIGVFGYMLIYLPKLQYGIYYTFLGFAVILFFAVLSRQKTERRDNMLMLMMLLSAIITVVLHFWQSYARDYQPQGRYVITLIIPLAYMMVYGLDKTVLAVRDPKPGKAAELNPAAVLTVLWLVLFAWAACGTMSRMLT
ncbi:MAG: hypothetical protein IJH70_01325 [Oscillospiraceae bacterium]|nr:hypothetical protein [Oscillospiraceae bacterium]